MRKKRVFRALPIIIAGLLMLAGTAFAQPKIVFKAESIDLGRVGAGKALQGVFEVKNAGDEPLEIKELVPT